MNDVTRSPILAALLGVVAPGLGLVFAGRGLAGVLFAVVWIVAGAGVTALVMDADPAGLARAHLLFSAFAHVSSAIAGAFFARRPAHKKGYEHWWWLFGFAMFAWAAQSQVRERLVAPRIGTFWRVFDNSMEPGFALGDLLVIDARRAPDPGDVVLVQGLGPEGSPGLARVIARQGQNARIDNSRLFVDEVAVAESQCRPDEIRAPGLACVAQTLGATRFVFGGERCDVPITSVAAGQLFVAPDARSAEHCKRLAKLVQKSDVLGVVIRAR
jgi:hypothetical protein